MKEFRIAEIANEIDTSDYKIEVQLEVQANADALSAVARSLDSLRKDAGTIFENSI